MILKRKVSKTLKKTSVRVPFSKHLHVSRMKIRARSVDLIPSGKNCQKNSPKECVFVNSALKLQFHVVKKSTFLQTAFSAIFPTRLDQHSRANSHFLLSWYSTFRWMEVWL